MLLPTDSPPVSPMLPSHLRLPLLKAAIAILLFGTVPAAIRQIKMDAYALGIVRLSVATVVMTILFAAIGKLNLRQLRRGDWQVLAAIGLLFGLHWLCYFYSIKEVSASVGAIGFTTFGVQIPLLGWLLGFGRPSYRTFAALGLALVGAVLCAPAETFSAVRGNFFGLVVGVLSGTFYAALPLLHQRHARLSHEVRTWGQFVFALPVFLLLLPKAQWSLPSHQWWLLIHLALVVTLAAHFLWIQAATVLPISLTGVLAYLQLPTTLAFNWLLIEEPLTLTMLVGAALVIVANALAISDRPRLLKDQN